MNETELPELRNWGCIEFRCSVSEFIESKIRAEVSRAKAIHPEWPSDPFHAFAIVSEEYGEAAKDILQTAYESHKSNRHRIGVEVIQLAAMCHRFLESLYRYEFKPSAQHSQS